MDNHGDIGDNIIVQLYKYFHNVNPNPIRVFELTSPLSLSSDDLLFVGEIIPELFNVIEILAGIALYCSDVVINIDGECVVISFNDDILKIVKRFKNISFEHESSFECSSDVTKNNMDVLISRGFPKRSEGQIVLNIQQ